MFSLFTIPSNEFRAFLDQTSKSLDTKELEINFGYAKEFLGDNYFYSIAPSSRLKYIQDRLKEKGVKDFTETGADSHRIATIMQLIYGFDMSIPEPAALMFLFGPFMINTMEQMGLLSANPDGSVCLTDKAFAETESMPLEERLKIEAKMEIVTQEAFGNSETGELSEENVHSNFELKNFALPGRLGLPKEMQPNVEILKLKYIEKFGKPEKLGRYICPIDKPVINFCSQIIERETGKKLPETEYLLDFDHSAPYLCKNKVAIPAVAITDESMLVQCIAAELPHLIFPFEGLAIDDFKKDRLLFFKRDSWVEGVPLRLQEKVLEEYLARAGIRMSASKAIAGIAKQGIPLEQHMHPAFVELEGMKTMMNYAVYSGISYIYGWHFVRQLDGQQFKKHLNYEKPWDSKKLGWNKPLNEADQKAVEAIYNTMRNASDNRYKGVLKEEHYNMMMKAFDQWKADFLK